MNNRNKHIQYRKSIYRKKRIKTIVIASVVAVCALIVLFLVIGNILNDKVNESKNTDEDVFEQSSSTEASLSYAQAVQAYALPLLEDGSSFSSRLSSINTDADAVCINLSATDGTLLFASSIASRLSGFSVHEDAVSLASSLSGIDARELYVSGLLHINAFEESNDLLLDVKLSSAGALVCEAIRDGVDDVLIMPSEFSADDIEALCSLADRIHSTEEKAIVGLVLSEDIYTAENRISLIDRLSKHFNYLCINAAENGDTEMKGHIEARIAEMQLDIMYYKMRVLLPHTSDAALQDEYLEIARKYNISSWLILP